MHNSYKRHFKRLAAMVINGYGDYHARYFDTDADTDTDAEERWKRETRF